MRLTGNFLGRFLAVGLIALLIQSCTKDSGPIVIVPEPPTQPIPNDTVSFLDDVQVIFQIKCWFCHPVSGELNLGLNDAYDQLVDMESYTYSPAIRVVPYDTANSVLYHKIIGDDVFGLLMPPGGSVLTDNEKMTITKWILQGALNN